MHTCTCILETYVRMDIAIYIYIYSIPHILTIVFPDTSNVKYLPIFHEVTPDTRNVKYQPIFHGSYSMA